MHACIPHSSGYFFVQLLSQVSEEGVPSTSFLLSSEMHSLEEIDPELFECISDVVDGLLVDVSYNSRYCWIAALLLLNLMSCGVCVDHLT